MICLSRKASYHEILRKAVLKQQETQRITAEVPFLFMYHT